MFPMQLPILKKFRISLFFQPNALPFASIPASQNGFIIANTNNLKIIIEPSPRKIECLCERVEIRYVPAFNF